MSSPQPAFRRTCQHERCACVELGSATQRAPSGRMPTEMHASKRFGTGPRPGILKSPAAGGVCSNGFHRRSRSHERQPQLQWCSCTTGGYADVKSRHRLARGQDRRCCGGRKDSDCGEEPAEGGRRKAPDVPGSWTTKPAAAVRPPVLISGLIPGTTYVFQARAVTKAGYSDWSESVTRVSLCNLTPMSSPESGRGHRVQRLVSPVRWSAELRRELSSHRTRWPQKSSRRCRRALRRGTRISVPR